MNNCIFCKIINKEIPSAVIYEDAEFMVILDRFPASRGHMLILPKIHAENIFELDEATGAKLFALAVKTANLLNERLAPHGLNVLQNNGEAAGQTVHHFHMHLIPRFDGDDISIKWKALQLTDDDINDMRDRLV